MAVPPSDHHPKWDIRRTTDDDRAVGQDVVRRTWQDAYAEIFTPEEIAGMFEGRLSMISSWHAGRTERIGTLAARDAGVIIGISSLALRQKGDGELVALYVLPEYQGRGVGWALWEASVAALRERGCPGMQVWVLAANRPAIRFYERQRCVRFAEGTVTVGNHEEPALGYRLEL